MADSHDTEPTKPPKLSFVGFDGPISGEEQIIRESFEGELSKHPAPPELNPDCVDIRDEDLPF
jgi:hypothetical protein